MNALEEQGSGFQKDINFMFFMRGVGVNFPLFETEGFFQVSKLVLS